MFWNNIWQVNCQWCLSIIKKKTSKKFLWQKKQIQVQLKSSQTCFHDEESKEESKLIWHIQIVKNKTKMQKKKKKKKKKKQQSNGKKKNTRKKSWIQRSNGVNCKNYKKKKKFFFFFFFFFFFLSILVIVL